VSLFCYLLALVLGISVKSGQAQKRLFEMRPGKPVIRLADVGLERLGQTLLEEAVDGRRQSSGIFRCYDQPGLPILTASANPPTSVVITGLLRPKAIWITALWVALR
jgi:hypothetical protein